MSQCFAGFATGRLRFVAFLVKSFHSRGFWLLPTTHLLAISPRVAAVTSLTSAAIWSSLLSLASRARRRLLLEVEGSIESLRLGIDRRLPVRPRLLSFSRREYIAGMQTTSV